MKMKKLLSLLTAAALSASCAVGFTTGASAATEADLVPISTSMTYWFDEATSKGTAVVGAGTLFGGNQFYSPKGNSSPSQKKGSFTVDGEKYYNSLRLKNVQNTLVFKTAKDCDITIYTQSDGSRGTVVTSTALEKEYAGYDAAVDGGAVAVQSVSTTEFTYSTTGEQTHYLSTYGGDFYLAGVKVDVKSTDPSISVSPLEKTISVGDTFTVSATTSNIGDASVVWSSDDAAIASVDNGVVTGVKAGKTKINATVTVGGTDYKASCDVTVVDNATITYSMGDVTAEGTVPPANTVQKGTQATIPANRTLYVEGKTLTKWTDGTNDYIPGQSVTLNADITVTPVFEANTASLGDEDAAVVFDFQRKNGAPTFALQGNKGILVEQAVIGGKTIDVKMDIDTTAGKLANAGWTDWAQVIPGTKFTVPTVADSVVTVGDIFSADGTYTINGVSKKDDNGSEKIAEAGTVDVVAGDPSGSYWRTITVTYPKKTVVEPTVSYEPTKVFSGNSGNPVAVFKAAITAGSYTVTNITWTAQAGTASVSKPMAVEINAGSTVVCGLIVEAKTVDVNEITAWAVPSGN